MRRSDDDPVRVVRAFRAVRRQDSAGDRRRRRYPVVLLDLRNDPIGRKDAQRGLLRDVRERVRVFADPENLRLALGALTPKVDDRLNNRFDMRLVERPVRRLAAVPATSKSDPFFRNFYVRLFLKIISLQRLDVDKIRRLRRLTGSFVNHFLTGSLKSYAVGKSVVGARSPRLRRF